MQITKYVLDLYKFISYIFLFYFVGWFSEKYFVLNSLYFFLLLSILILIQIIFFKKKNFLTIVIIFLLLGNYIGQKKNFYFNIWIQDSLEQLKSHSIGFFLLKVKWKIEGRDINIFFDRNNFFSVSKNVKNLNSHERLIFSLDYLPLFMVYYDENNKIKKRNILSSSSNAGVIYSDSLNNLISYNSQTGNIMQRIKIENKKIKKIWQIKGKYFFHHWGDYFENNIYIPGRKYIKRDELKNIDYYKNKNCTNQFVNKDIIYLIDFDTGKIMDEIDIFDILINYKISKKFSDCVNPIHLNDIEVIKKTSQQNYFNNAKIGDYLISLRNINTILLIDHDTKEIKWSYDNELNMQHSPQITDRGTLLIFNNKGSKEIKDQSRIDEVDLKTKKIVGIYDGVLNNFYSEKRGRIQYIEGRIIIQESEKSNLFEIICKGAFISNDCEKKNIITIDSKFKDIFQSFTIDLF